MKAAELQAKRANAKKALQQFLKSPAGQDAIDVLRTEFGTDDIKQADTHETYYRLGLSDALKIFTNLSR